MAPGRRVGSSTRCESITQRTRLAVMRVLAPAVSTAARTEDLPEQPSTSGRQQQQQPRAKTKPTVSGQASANGVAKRTLVPRSKQLTPGGAVSSSHDATGAPAALSASAAGTGVRAVNVKTLQPRQNKKEKGGVPGTPQTQPSTSTAAAAGRGRPAPSGPPNTAAGSRGSGVSHGFDWSALSLPKGFKLKRRCTITSTPTMLSRCASVTHAECFNRVCCGAARLGRTVTHACVLRTSVA